MKKKIILSLMIAIAAIVMSLTVKGNTTVKAEETSVNKDTFVSYFTAVGDTVSETNLVDYVKSVSYGDFTATNFSGGGVMVETQNKAADSGWLINMPEVKYSTGVKFNKVVDLSDNTSTDTLIEVAFPGTNSNDQIKGFKVIIEDASNPDKYITLYIWEAYDDDSAYKTSKSHILAAASATWETNKPNDIKEAAFDTDDYNNDGTPDDGVLVKVSSGGVSGDYGKDQNDNDKEICWLNAGSPHGHKTTSVKFSKESNYTFKIQFDNETGTLLVNDVRVRKFSQYSALRPSSAGNSGSIFKKYGSNVYDKFSNNKVKLSVGVIRTNRGNTDETSRFCIMNIDGNNLEADESDNIAYNGLDINEAYTISKADMLSNFVLKGDYATELAYGEFTTEYFSGGGAMVTLRNKLHENVDNTDNDNSTNPILINNPNTKYSSGVLFDKPIDISDNTSFDTLLEFAFPGENDNFQVRGFKVVIEDAYDPDKYITLFVWNTYESTAAIDTGKSQVLASASATWETTDPNSIVESGFDTDDYNNYPNHADATGTLMKMASYDSTINGESNGKEIMWLNNGTPHGHRVTSVKFSRKSDNSFKIQFDNATGTLLVNGVRIRKFSSYSMDGEHFFDGFTNDKVKVSFGVYRSVRRSTDEFTKVCIMNIDGNSLKADANELIHYYGGFDAAPESGLIASGNTTIPAPIHNDLLAEPTAIESGVTVTITDPNNKVTENYTGAKFDFDLIGTYEIEYFVNGSSVGTAQFKTAAKDGESNLSELASFSVTSGLYAGKNIALADFTVMADAQLPITAATVTIYNGETVLATETADANWSYTLQAKGELTFKVATDSFTVATTATVLPGIFPTAAIENGSVSINGEGSAIGLNSDLLTFTLTPAEGYRLKSLMIDGQDVTADVEDGEYELEPESMENNITYTATFEVIPKFTVTYKDGETTVGTVSDVIEGTLFKDVTAPTAPTKVGYTFTGWSVDANSAITADVAATAQYETITYTITYNLDGGTNSTENKATYTVEDAFTLANPTKEGYNFLGWSNEASEAVTAVALGTTGNLTFTAHWEADEPVDPVVTTTEPPTPVDPVVTTTEPPTPVDPVVTTTEEPTPVVTTTEAPAPVTEAPAPETTTSPSETAPKRKGCKGALVPSIVGVVLLLGSIVVIKRKREE